MAKNLLKAALEVIEKRKIKEFTSEEIELCEAYLDGIITLKQACRALEIKETNMNQVYGFIASCCKYMRKIGKI